MQSRPLLLTLLAPLALHAHHEAVFGPQSAALLAKPGYVSVQYYFTNEGQAPADLMHSNIGVLSVATRIRSSPWGVSLALPFEIQGGSPDAVQGLHDPVLGVRYTPRVGTNKNFIATLTLEPPATSLEVRAFGVGGGALYAAEKGHWSSVLYTLARTEHSFQEGTKRGNRFFAGGGLAFEAKSLPFSPQVGMSWEHTGARIADGQKLIDSRTNALMLHPTVVKTFREERISTFFVVSVPAAQWSGHEGWQRWRVATGVVYSF
jgi:hypothetical protein